MTAAYLTTREVAQIIQRSEEYVTRRCIDGDLTAVKLGNAWRVKPEWLDEFMTPTATVPREVRRLTTKQRKGVAARKASA